jgi:hypothetical protein
MSKIKREKEKKVFALLSAASASVFASACLLQRRRQASAPSTPTCSFGGSLHLFSGAPYCCNTYLYLSGFCV